MCGIVGYYSLTSSCSAVPDLEAMTDVLVHRGPDDRGSYRDGPVGLGMCRLSIIDLVNGRQPIANETGRLQVVFNGEIYNYRELRAELTACGHVWSTDSDTEAIVHGYEEWGDEVVTRLRGRFAFALWDGDRERLLLARDPFGVKPLYYTSAAGWLLFASEIKSLLLFPQVARRPDMRAIDQYLSFLYIPAPRTIFEGIFELAPGHLLTCQVGRFAVRRYYQLALEEPDRASETELLERIRAAFEESVAAMLVSDVPLGAFLSGGIDSSSIVAMARRHTAAPVKTFSIGFGTRERHWDELESARRVAEFYGTEHRAFRVAPDIVELLPQVIWHFDQPFANPTAVLMLLLSRETRRHVKVALAGTGGDELFAGYPRYLGMQAYAYYRRLPRSLRNGLSGMANRLLRDSSDGRLGAQRARRFLAGGSLSFEECYLRWLAAIDDSRKAELYDDGMRAALGPSDTFDFIRPLLQDEKSGPESERLFLTDFQTYLPFNQLAYADRMSMAASLEVRVPFVDQRLVQAVRSIPLRERLSGRTTKGLFRKAMAPLLPPWILQTPKQGLNAPVTLWFRHDLRKWVHSLLSPEVITARGIFRPEPISRLMAEQEAGTRDHSLVIWALVVLELWQRMYLDRADLLTVPDASALGAAIPVRAEL